MLATTKVDGKVVLRMCLINPNAKMHDIEVVIQGLELFAEKYLAEKRE